MEGDKKQKQLQKLETVLYVIKKSMTVNDNTIEAEGKGHLFEK